MGRFVEGTDREQSTLFPEYLEDWIGEDNPVRVIDVFVDERGHFSRRDDFRRCVANIGDIVSIDDDRDLQCRMNNNRGVARFRRALIRRL